MIMQHNREYNKKTNEYESYTAISITDNPDDAIRCKNVVEHEKYSELMDLADDISRLNTLWYAAEEDGDEDAQKEHDELNKAVAEKYNELIPNGNWDTAGTYEESFWEVVNLATGNAK